MSKISVIVPAFNEEKLLGATLRRIKEAATRFAERGWEFELVVCDNNSKDRTPDIAREEGAQVIFEPINQISRARNAGASIATGDWFVFVDADSHPTRELFDDLLNHIETGRYLGGGATIRLDLDRLAPRLVAGIWNRISRVAKWAAGSFVFCEAQTFRDLGGFSTELYASEEIDFSKRLQVRAKAAGKRMVILQRAPLVTSARKVHLYTPWEHLRLLGRAAFSGGRSLKTRENCNIWYDGRR